MEDFSPATEWGSNWISFWQLPDGWQVSDEDAAFLQRIAWETVQAYQAGRQPGE
jgi:hypothetical protein